MNSNELNSYLVKVLDLPGDQICSVLDIGCGYGLLLAQIADEVMPESRLVGIDSAAESIEWAGKKHSNIEFQCSKFVDAIDFPDSSFDVVVSVDTLECIPDKDQFLREVARVLKPDGRVLIAHWDWDTQAFLQLRKQGHHAARCSQFRGLAARLDGRL